MLSLDFLTNDYDIPKSPYEKAVRSIAIDILSGLIPEGKRIGEQGICEKFGVSRTIARQVLQNLENASLVKIIHNRGAFSTPINGKQIDDYLYLKSILFPQCVKWAIERISDEELDMLDETFSFMEYYTRLEDLDKMIRINQGFDSIIYHACKNRELERNLVKYDFILRYATANIRYPSNYLESVLEERRAIYSAFTSKSIEDGIEAANIHMYKTILRRK